MMMNTSLLSPKHQKKSITITMKPAGTLLDFQKMEEEMEGVVCSIILILFRISSEVILVVFNSILYENEFILLLLMHNCNDTYNLTAHTHKY